MAGKLKAVLGVQARELRRQRRERLRQARRLRWRHRWKRLRRALIAVAVILAGALAASLAFDGISDSVLVLTVFAVPIAFILFALFPRTSSLSASGLPAESLPGLADHTQTWLETQRGLLPAAARVQVDLLGSHLAQLSPQLANLAENDPAAGEVRKLLGEHLPSLVESYTSIPVALRSEPHAGSTPQAQLTEGLATVAREVEAIGKTVARGELDALATRGRYLETRYDPAGPEDDPLAG